jgi:hypothetical protein
MEAQMIGADALQNDARINYERLGEALDQLNIIFILIFTSELGVNLYANWFRRFITNGW